MGQPVLRQDVAARLLPLRWPQRHRQSASSDRAPGVPDAVRRTRGSPGRSLRGSSDRPTRRRAVRRRARRPGVRSRRRQVDDALLASSWTSLARLHDAGICHGGITPEPPPGRRWQRLHRGVRSRVDRLGRRLTPTRRGTALDVDGGRRGRRPCHRSGRRRSRRRVPGDDHDVRATSRDAAGTAPSGRRRQRRHRRPSQGDDRCGGRRGAGPPSDPSILRRQRRHVDPAGDRVLHDRRRRSRTSASQSIIDAISRRERADPDPGADHRPDAHGSPAPSARRRPHPSRSRTAG